MASTTHAARGANFWLAAALLTLAVLVWSGSAVVGRMAADHVPPITLSFWRWAIAFVVLLPFAGPTLWRRRDAIRRGWKWLSVLSFLGMGGFAVPYFVGLQFTQAANAAILNALGPMMILVISVTAMGARTTTQQILGLLLGIAGTALIIFRGDWDEVASFAINIGDALILLAVFFWSAYTVVLKHVPAELDQMSLLTILSGLTLPMLAPFYALEFAIEGGFALDAHNLAIVLYSGFCSSVLAYLCWNRGVAVIGPSRAGASQYLMPVFGAVMAAAILGEELAWFHLAGMVLIFAGIACSSRREG
jgi:drug/metabolite transporter (DMT)-like permease